MKEIEKFNAGRYESGYGYKYFIPETINNQWCWKDPSINKLLEKASIKLGELNSFSQYRFVYSITRCQRSCCFQPY